MYLCVGMYERALVCVRAFVSVHVCEDTSVCMCASVGEYL